MIATEALNRFPVSSRCPAIAGIAAWSCPGHPLTSLDHCSLEAIAEHPIVTTPPVSQAL